MKVDEERVTELLEDTALAHGMLDLVVLDDVLLAQHLHRVDFPRCVHAHKHHLPKVPLPYQLEQREVVHSHLPSHLICVIAAAAVANNVAVSRYGRVFFWKKVSNAIWFFLKKLLKRKGF